MSKETKKAGRPANPVLETVRKEDVEMAPNVRFKYLWNIDGYSPMDVSLYGDAIDKIWNSVQDQWDSKVLRYTQTPIMYRREDGKLIPQVGNTRTLAWLTRGKSDQEMAVEIRSKEMTEEERLAENTIRTDMGELAIAYTLYGKKGAEYKRAMIATGWSEAKCKQWSLIMNTLPNIYWLWIEQGRVTLDTALELCSQDQQLINFIDGALRGNQVKETKGGDRWSKGIPFILWKSIDNAIIIRHDSPLLTEPVDKPIAPISESHFAIPYHDGMTTSWYVFDKPNYQRWYLKRKSMILQSWGLNEVENGEEYSGQLATESARIKYEPFLGKGKAYWYKDSLMVQVNNKAEKAVSKVDKLQEATDKTKAADYADKQLSKEAQNILAKSEHTLTEVEMTAMLSIEYGIDKETPLNTLLYTMLTHRTSFMREGTKRILMPDYDKRYAQLIEQYLDDKQEMLDAEKEALRKKMEASVSIFFAPHVFIPWRIYSAERMSEHIFLANKVALEHVKEQCKMLGIAVSWHDKQRACEMIKRGLDKWVEKWGDREQALYEHKNAQWAETKETIDKHMKHLALWLDEDIDDENSDTIDSMSYDVLNKRFIDFMHKWYKRDVYLKWMGKEMSKWCGERADGGKKLHDVMHVLIAWLMDNKQRIPSYGEVPASPMPEPKAKVAQVVETTTEMEVEYDDDYDESDEEQDYEYEDEKTEM